MADLTELQMALPIHVTDAAGSGSVVIMSSAPAGTEMGLVVRNSGSVTVLTHGVNLNDGAGNAVASGTAAPAGTERGLMVRCVGVSATTGVGVAGTAATGVVTVQGIASMTPVQVASPTPTTGAGTIIAATTVVVLTGLANHGTGILSVSGTYAGVNLTFESSDDGGTTWFLSEGVRSDNTASESSSGVLGANLTRAWFLNLHGGALNAFRVRATAWTSGAANIRLTFTRGTGAKSVVVQGDTPTGTLDSGSPVKIGAVARTTNPTAQTNAIRADLMCDYLGRLVTVPNHCRDLIVQNTVLLTTVTETTVLTLVASAFLDVTHIVISNNSATQVFVEIRDATAGTVRQTIAVAASGGGAVIPFPTPMKQAIAAQNWTAKLSAVTTGGSVSVYMQAAQNL